jgi:hypothetical protein
MKQSRISKAMNSNSLLDTILQALYLRLFPRLIQALTNRNKSSWSAKWYTSCAYLEMRADIAAISSISIEARVNGHKKAQTSFNASSRRQIRIVSLRTPRTQSWRPQYVCSQIWAHLLSGILVGLTFYTISTSPSDF